MARHVRLVLLTAVLAILSSQLATPSQGQTPTPTVSPCIDREKIYHYKDLPKKSSKKAKILKQPNPEYTSEARRNKIQGIVTLKAVFRCDGTVSDISVVEGLPDGLTEVSIEAARKIKFRPAIINGEPVSLWMAVQYWFSLY